MNPLMLGWLSPWQWEFMDPLMQGSLSPCWWEFMDPLMLGWLSPWQWEFMDPPDARFIVSMAMRIYGPSDARFIVSMAMGMWQIGLHETDWEYHRQLGQHTNLKLEERRLLRIGTSSTGCYPVWCRGTCITHRSNRAWLLTGIFRWSKLV